MPSGSGRTLSRMPANPNPGSGGQTPGINVVSKPLAVSGKDTARISRVKGPDDGIYKIYPVTKTFTCTANVMEALSIYDLMGQFGSMKVDVGIPANCVQLKFNCHLIGITSGNPVIMEKIHFGLLTTEAGATISSNIESTTLFSAIAGMSDQDLVRYEELGEMTPKIIVFPKSDLTEYRYLRNGEIEIDLTGIVRKLTKLYNKAELENSIAELPVVHLVAIMESDVDSVAKTIQGHFTLLAQASKAVPLMKLT